MKRLALVATVLALAACATKEEAPVDTAPAAPPAMAPAPATDSAAKADSMMKADSMRKDTTAKKP